MPTLREKIDLTDWVVKSIGSIVGVVAPTAALVALGKLPDQLAQPALYVLPAVTAAMIVALIIVGGQIGKLSPRMAAVLTLACAVAGALLTVAYAQFTFDQVVGTEFTRDGEVESVEREIKPLSPSGEIQQILRVYGGDYREALLRRRGDELRILMRAENGSATMLIWAMMIGAQLLFVAAVVGGAWWLAEQDDAHGPPDTDPSPPDGAAMEPGES